MGIGERRVRQRNRISNQRRLLTYTANMSPLLIKIWKVLWIPVAIILLLLIGLTIYRIPFVLEKQKTEEAIAFINAQKLTMNHVDGNHLPPTPDPAAADATIEGIDVNANSIRDDVELAIFEKYPNDIKIRAAMLQYAMALQLYVTKVFNSETWKAAVMKKSKAFFCLGEAFPRPSKEKATDKEWDKFFEQKRLYENEIEKLVFNNNSRKDRSDEISKKYTTSVGSGEEPFCDLNTKSF